MIRLIQYDGGFWFNSCQTWANTRREIPDGTLSAISDAGGMKPMLWTIFVILLVLWLLGLVTSYTLGGFIHILLLVALAVLVIQLITGRRAV